MITHFVSNAIIVEVSSRERNILRTCLCIKLGTWWAWVNKHYKSTHSMKTHSSILLCRDSGRFQETWSVHQVALVVTSSAKCMNVATIRDLPQSRMWVCPSGVQLESQCHFSAVLELLPPRIIMGVVGWSFRISCCIVSHSLPWPLTGMCLDT